MLKDWALLAGRSLRDLEALPEDCKCRLLDFACFLSRGRQKIECSAQSNICLILRQITLCLLLSDP